MSRKPGNWAVTTYGKPSGGTRINHEMKSKSSYHDKQSGSYGHVTTKGLVSSWDYVNCGRAGFKDEYKASTTVRLGDKRGYTEYSTEERATRVKYDGSFGSSSKGIKGYDSGSRSISSGLMAYNNYGGNNGYNGGN